MILTQAGFYFVPSSKEEMYLRFETRRISQRIKVVITFISISISRCYQHNFERVLPMLNHISAKVQTGTSYVGRPTISFFFLFSLLSHSLHQGKLEPSSLSRVNVFIKRNTMKAQKRERREI